MASRWPGKRSRYSGATGSSPRLRRDSSSIASSSRKSRSRAGPSSLAEECRRVGPLAAAQAASNWLQRESIRFHSASGKPPSSALARPVMGRALPATSVGSG